MVLGWVSSPGGMVGGIDSGCDNKGCGLFVSPGIGSGGMDVDAPVLVAHGGVEGCSPGACKGCLAALFVIGPCRLAGIGLRSSSP